jgi:peptidoglycan/xylan/chitin deacetylase (PgdA/CDA1 family)
VKAVFAAIGLCAALLCASLPAHASAACPADRGAPAETPAIPVPTAGGPAYGTMQYPLTVELAPRQVALTFDDGPDPATTLQILDTLDRHCVKAVFFMVGIYAERHPEIVREVAARGHTIGSHTWSHPNNLRQLSLTAAKREIRRGFDAIETALASAPDEQRDRLAPFFRFPGLNDSKALIAWLGDRNIATLSCEFGSDDWRRISPWEVKRRSLRNIASVGQGILILHDTKPRTAAMLSDFIVELRAAGYELVQLVPEEGAHELAAAAPDPLLRPKRRAGANPAEQSASIDSLTIPSLERQAELR